MVREELAQLLDEDDSNTPEARVARLMSERGAVSAADISRATGLAKSTISNALAELRRTRVVVEAPASESARGVGRPASAFALNPRAGTCFGVHLSLDCIRTIVADVSHSVICEQTIPLGRDYSPEAAAAAAQRSMRALYAEHDLSPHGLLGVGLSFSGPVTPDGRILRASIVPTWAGVNIRDVFGPVLPHPLYADNESNCAALAEMTWGAAVGVEDFVFFTLDLGVGGAIVSNGRVSVGAAGGAGEFGHITIDPAGDLCRCGNRGCLELSASFMPALAAASRHFGRAMEIEEIIALAQGGHVGCARLIEDTGLVAGRGLGMIGAVLNPGLVLIGGRGALAGEILLAPLRQSYDRHTLIKHADAPEANRTRIEVGRFAAQASLMGAVALVLRRHGRLN
jgi:predicted NBD/HSP70 family sugar kinase/predicted transcriptional regulator